MNFRILYLHPAAAFGGSSKSLIELFKAFPDGAVTATVICPHGSAAESFHAAGFEVIECAGLPQWDNTRYGYYRGLRWLILLREIWLAIPAAWTLLRTLRTRKFDAIHANDITVLPLAQLGRRYAGIPLVVHVRSLQRINYNGFVNQMIDKMLSHTDAIIAIDQTVRRTLSPAISVTIIHNGIQPPAPNHARTVQRVPLKVAMVGVLLGLKGVYEFLQAARICHERGLAVEFLIAGENPRKLAGIRKWVLGRMGFAHDVRADLERYIQENDLGDMAKLLGFVKNVQALYADIDLLCFPSHLDAAGRPVFEAAFCSVPALVAAINPEPDTLIDGVTGMCIKAKDPDAIADAIEYLLKNPEVRHRLGENARQLAYQNFDINHNALEVLAQYQSLTSKA